MDSIWVITKRVAGRESIVASVASRAIARIVCSIANDTDEWATFGAEELCVGEFNQNAFSKGFWIEAKEHGWVAAGVINLREE